MKKPKFPVIVTKPGVTARIRKTSQIQNGAKYPLFVVDYHLLVRRKREARTNFDEARQVALTACRRIASGEQASLTLTNDDQMIYQRAKEALALVGVPLDVAATDYAAAVKLLPTGATLKEAVEFFRVRNPAALEKRTVRQVANEILAVTRAAKLSNVHLKNLEMRSARFAGRVPWRSMSERHHRAASRQTGGKVKSGNTVSPIAKGREQSLCMADLFGHRHGQQRLVSPSSVRTGRSPTFAPIEWPREQKIP